MYKKRTSLLAVSADATKHQHDTNLITKKKQKTRKKTSIAWSKLGAQNSDLCTLHSPQMNKNADGWSRLQHTKFAREHVSKDNMLHAVWPALHISFHCPISTVWPRVCQLGCTKVQIRQGCTKLT